MLQLKIWKYAIYRQSITLKLIETAERVSLSKCEGVAHTLNLGLKGRELK